MYQSPISVHAITVPQAANRELPSCNRKRHLQDVVCRQAVVAAAFAPAHADGLAVEQGAIQGPQVSHLGKGEGDPMMQVMGSKVLAGACGRGHVFSGPSPQP